MALLTCLNILYTYAYTGSPISCVYVQCNIVYGVSNIYFFLMENNADQTCGNEEKRISEPSANLN
jgi:hypothetical protein